MAETRRRRKSFKFDAGEILTRLTGFAEAIESARTDDIELRIQRYAKFRGWTSGMTAWTGSSDAVLPDMMSNSLRTQDTLMNAVLSTRPAVIAQAVNKTNKEKQDLIDNLLDFQFFVEQPGETILSELVECFTNDGNFVAYVPWVKELRMTSDIRVFPAIPGDSSAVEHFQNILRSQFPGKIARLKKESPWDWEVIDPTAKDEPADIAFYTNELDEVEMIVKQEAEVYNGPRVLVKNYEDVLAPVTAANLQIPGPSNPNGAQFVILRDYPTVDEVMRLISNGYYDAATKEDKEKLQPSNADKGVGTHSTLPNVSLESVKNELRGLAANTDTSTNKDKGHGTVERFIVFDTYDIDGDGINEDVVWWCLRSPEIMLRARVLTEVFPGTPPRRPLAEASYLPIKGRRDGIGILELQEGLHDLMKVILDLTVDGGSLGTNPFFFYRASGNIKPEVIRLAPGEGYPLSNPQQDVHFPVLSNQYQSFGLNMLAALEQMQDKVTMVGDLQYGKVPAGRSAAFRTAAGMQTLLSQSESRPENILRRFFHGLANIWALMHRLNQSYLSPGKQFRVIGYSGPSKDPYSRIEQRDQIVGQFDFDFKASLMNSTPALLQQAMDSMLATFVSGIALQIGVIDQDGIYRLLLDWAKSHGQDGTRYLKAPSPMAAQPRITAAEAISTLLDGIMPVGIPLEPLQEHLQSLIEFRQDPNFALLTPTGQELFMAWLQQVAMLLQQQAQQQQMQMAAGPMGQPPGAAQGMMQGGAEPMPMSGGQMQQQPGRPPVQGNELIDETLPSNRSEMK